MSTRDPINIPVFYCLTSGSGMQSFYSVMPDMIALITKACEHQKRNHVVGVSDLFSDQCAQI